MTSGVGRADEPLVELVDPAGRPVGAAGKRQAHDPPGQLHRAFSVFLLDSSGRLLLQRRAATKYHSAGLWSNTCCGHPFPGEDPKLAACRRMASELGLDLQPRDLGAAGIVVYELADPVSGLVEREFNHLFVGWAAGPIQPNPAEVAEVAAISLTTPQRL